MRIEIPRRNTAPAAMALSEMALSAMLLVVASFTLTLAAPPTVCRAQDGDAQKEEFERRYQQKLDSAFMQRLEWVQEFDAAQAAAREKNLPILAYFTTSKVTHPGCAWVEQTVFTDEWAKLLKPRIVPYVNIASGLEDQPDQDLLKKKGGKGLPYMLLMDRQGEVMHVFSMDENAYSVRRVIERVQELITARVGVDEAPKDKVAKARLTLIEGFHDPTEADLKKMKKAARVKGLEEDFVGRYESFRTRYPVLIVEAEYDEYVYRAPSKDIRNMDDVRRFRAEQAERGKIADVKAGRKIYKLYKKKKNRITDAEDALHWPFWRWAFIGARENGDKRTATRVFEYIEEHFESDGQLRSEVMAFRAQLDDI